ncbi:hypothetical protein DIPPA_63770 [Diplonema papillatum]|nr:hypothetical protein DIPPA_63770 [Diplonema papillatum]
MVYGTRTSKVVEVPCSVSEVNKNRDDRPCAFYIDVSFPTPTKLNYIVFQNFFTEAIVIKHSGLQASNRREWSTVLPREDLMRSPHSESDAQDWHCFDVFKKFDRTFDCFRVSCLRIFLIQSSPHWLVHQIHSLQCYAAADCFSESRPQPVVPLVPVVADTAQQLLALAQVIKTQRQQYSDYDLFSRFLDRVPLEETLRKGDLVDVC